MFFLLYQYSNKCTSINFYKKTWSVTCQKFKLVGWLQGVGWGWLDGMKSEERVYFHMGKESLFNCLLYVCVLGGGGYNCQVAAAVIILNDIT